MKRLLLIFLLIFLSISVHAQQLDPAIRKALDNRLEEYAAAIHRENADVKRQECDFLIDSAADSLVRQHVAVKLYGHYLESPLMGDEAVAIHIFDRWFASGKVAMYTDADLINARVFADFNRQSLIGCKAPSLLLRDSAGNPEIIDFQDSGNRYKVLLFYDSSCSKCKVESILLRNFLSTSGYPVDFYAVFTGDDLQSWQVFLNERLAADYGKASVRHLWDPEMESDFQHKYGVIQTPRLFLISPDGTILGRGLDTESLAKMCGMIFREVKLDYGSDESYELFDEVFASSEGRPQVEEIIRIADHIADVTIAKGDTVMFRQMTGDLLYYLGPQTGSSFKEGTDYLIDKYILARPDVWRTEDDSIKVIGFAQMLDDLLSKSPKGTQVPDMTLPGELITSRQSKQGDWNLRRLRGKRNIIIFYTEGCHVCDAEKAAAARLVDKEIVGRKAARSTRILLVNVDRILEEYPEMSASLFDTFDLSALPFIVQTDNDAVIVEKYLSLLY